MSVHAQGHYERLAALFDYPQWDYPTRAREACRALEGRYPVAAAELYAFAEALPAGRDTTSADALAEMQDIFTRSFDVQSITTLSVGYLVFGDDYKRAELLVNLNREQREAGVDGGSELPDHLPNVLRLLARWRDRELAAEFIEHVLHPALRRMIAEFDTQRSERRNALYRKHYQTLIDTSARRGMIFRKPLAALASVLEADFGPCERASAERQHDFLGSIGQELEIEQGTRRGSPELVQLRSPQ